MGLGATVLLLAAGYLLGVRLGFASRERLRNDNLRLAQELQELDTRLLQQTSESEKSSKKRDSTTARATGTARTAFDRSLAIERRLQPAS